MTPKLHINFILNDPNLNFMINTKNIFISFLLIITLLLATSATWIYSRIDGALPQLNGKKTVFGLKETAIIERDVQGIATIKAKSRNDIAVATGFLHAQERFFQMDLLRRNSAGELSSLFGRLALDYDKSIRRHRFRARARTIVNQLPQEQLSLLKAYTRGVNQGLLALETAPFEYLLLQQEPVQWSEEDSILTIFSMYIDLQYHDGRRERTLGLMQSTLNSEVFAFLNPKGSVWDAAIDNTSYAPSPMPSQAWPAASAKTMKNIPSVNQQIISPLLAQISKGNYQTDDFPGSNNWAVAGNISDTGSAIIANDMHLNIRVPNTWFRASFEYFDKDNQKVKITGATLPGTPNMVIGSNGNIAWGFTNSYGDYSDIVLLTTNADKSQYLTPSGYKDFIFHKQIIAIKGEDAIETSIKETIWGPVIGENYQGQLMAYRWVAHDKQAINLTATELETAKNIDQAFNIAARSGIPSQNMMVGDKSGNIGWTIMGPIPKKSPNIGEIPTVWYSGDGEEKGWHGYLSPDEYPRIKNPSNDRLWTANSRVVGGEMLAKIGNGGYALGARSQQIRNDLSAKETFDEKALFAIGFDDRAIFLERWQHFLLSQVLTEKYLVEQPQLMEIRKQLTASTHLRADIDSVSYRLVRNFRANVRNLVFSELNSTLKTVDANFDLHTINHQLETPLWELITQQPENFLLRPEASWQLLFRKALQQTIDDMKMNDGTSQPLSAATWGQMNTTKIQHPLSKGVPFIGRWLDMPNHALSGDSYMPKVQGKAFGASERMVVSPGHEETGIFNMPTSQSGHPWSPYYGKGHSDWEQGITSPFLPGKTVYTLTLLSY